MTSIFTKPDTSLAIKTGHLDLLTTVLLGNTSPTKRHDFVVDELTPEERNPPQSCDAYAGSSIAVLRIYG